LLLPAAAVAGVIAAVAMAFLYAPTEAVQGHVQRIFYVHVPSAWIAYLAFAVAALASVLLLARSDERWDRVASSSAEIGVVFTTIVLITGPIWGRPVWGAWWVWDARLTSTLVLWIVYVGYLLYRSLTPPGPRRARTSAVIAIIGVADIPVIHFSVVWWTTLHPPPTVVRPDPQLTAEMLVTLLVAVAAFTLLYGALLAARVRVETLRSRVERLEARDA
jgi:heme exporter protein C